MYEHLDKPPAFNVIEPFDGVVILQMNKEMRDLLRNFIFEFDEIEVDMYALGEALTDPRQWHRKTNGVAFSTEQFEGVISVHLNRQMSKLVRTFIHECDGRLERELVALKNALANPAECYRLRKERERERQQFPRDERADDKTYAFVAAAR